MTHRMRVVCAWCPDQPTIGLKPCPPEDDGAVSHGICPACKERQAREIIGNFHAGTAPNREHSRPAPAAGGRATARTQAAAASTPQRPAARVVDFSCYVTAKTVAAAIGLTVYELETRHRPASWGSPRDFMMAGGLLFYRRESLLALVAELAANGRADAAKRLEHWLTKLGVAAAPGVGGWLREWEETHQ